MAVLRRMLRAAVIAICAAVLVLAGWGLLRGGAGDLPWAPLDLGDPVGAFTVRKLAALRGDFPQCRALLDRSGVHYTVLPTMRPRQGACGYDDGIRFAPGGARRIAFSPSPPALACPLAGGLAMWEWDVLQPAAERFFHARVLRVDHLGSYNCRRLYGRASGAWSEHASADAIDVAGFHLSDGRSITVAGDWRGSNAASGFLHAVRNGACGLFATVLSPDYNVAHHDHLHLDQAARGAYGGRACR